MTGGTPTAMIRYCRSLVPAGRRMIAMGVPDPAVYTLLVRFLQAVLQPTHATSFAAVSALVWAVLCAQSLHPADLVRALPDLTMRDREGWPILARPKALQHTLGSRSLTGCSPTYAGT